ncbi:MAG: hypothetical protein IKZ58_04830 [Selenomonadaceae bacterium]|nr:hypothetical protein [Selenomonadaceae bacterium]
MRKFLIGILAAMILSTSPVTFAKEVHVPENIFMWVQSTSRGNYFFNIEQMNYGVNYDGTIDLYTLNVPTLCTYDDIQIQDVIQKRRWKNQSLEGYNILAGRADYLTFDLRNGTVQITRRVDLDDTFTELDSDISGEPVKMSEIPRTSVMCRFYRTILIWARFNTDTLIERSKGKLSRRDAKLNPKDYPINKITLPGDLPKEELEEDKDKDDDKNSTINRRRTSTSTRIR